jgi:predicted DNA-binding transcriptional regulator AlpA
MQKPTSRAAAQTIPPIEVAAIVGVDVSTLHRWISRGIFPPATIKVGRTVRWSVQAVEKFIAEGVTA